MLKGANWFGAAGTRACMEDMNRVAPSAFISFLVQHQFNAVRIPLSVPYVLDPTRRAARGQCGEYSGWRYMDMIVHITQRLAQAGIFVVFDMHTVVFPEHNSPLWCIPGRRQTGCLLGDPARSARSQTASVQPLLQAWTIMAQRFCSHRNVIMADLYNEPYGAHWGSQAYGYPDSTDWATTAELVGNAVLNVCPRWLIMVEGIANNEQPPACYNATGGWNRTTDTGPGGWCWWGENVLGQLRRPIQLSVPDRLVLSPHAYGHGAQPYFKQPEFPANMPNIWEALWGRLPELTGVPVVVGEWGGLWSTTAAWQLSMQDYLRSKNISSFYCAWPGLELWTYGLCHALRLPSCR